MFCTFDPYAHTVSGAEEIEKGHLLSGVGGNESGVSWNGMAAWSLQMDGVL